MGRLKFAARLIPQGAARGDLALRFTYSIFRVDRRCLINNRRENVMRHVNRACIEFSRTEFPLAAIYSIKADSRRVFLGFSLPVSFLAQGVLAPFSHKESLRVSDCLCVGT